jgi:hypothetical protein
MVQDLDLLPTALVHLAQLANLDQNAHGTLTIC